MFLNTFTENNLITGNVDRDYLYSFTHNDFFLNFFHGLSNDIVKKLSLDKDNVLLQPNVTVRKFEPKSHGTSFHTDYLYGHGIKTYTIWIPLYGLQKGNSFWMYPKMDNDLSEKLALDYKKDLENKIIKECFEVLPEKNECIIFSSNTIHGSPINNSINTRYSFDFRISFLDDHTTTKKVDEYLILKNNMWVSQPNPFNELLFLKYICGGVNRDTSMQHEIIETVSKKKKIKIVAQEAEIERYGYKVFERYVHESSNEKGFNAIIIASQNIINSKCIDIIKNSNLKVYSALEGIFLN